MRPPKPAPVLTPEAVKASAAAIAAAQEPDGAIPWFPGGHTDAWDHLECAMALELGGQTAAADAAWAWLCRNQRADGAWPAKTVGGVVEEAHADSNQCAYVAAAAWHRWLLTGDRAFITAIWPVVRRAINFVVDLQAPSGQIWWARSASGEPGDEALITGCSSTLHSLRCAMAIAELVEEIPPAWENATAALEHALVAHPEYFSGRDRWSMDWYYPVIGGALRGDAGRAQLSDHRWDRFVVDGLGIRCVSDEPWVTGAETCELAIALHLVDETAAAAKLVADMQHLRVVDGNYWTGWQFRDQVFWPVEQSTWTAAAVILAVDTIAGGVTERLFRGDGLPVGRLLPHAGVPTGLLVPTHAAAATTPGQRSSVENAAATTTDAAAAAACGCRSADAA